MAPALMLVLSQSGWALTQAPPVSEPPNPATKERLKTGHFG
jgi:hypothetical protein